LARQGRGKSENFPLSPSHSRRLVFNPPPRPPPSGHGTSGAGAASGGGRWSMGRGGGRRVRAAAAGDVSRLMFYASHVIRYPCSRCCPGSGATLSIAPQTGQRLQQQRQRQYLPLSLQHTLNSSQSPELRATSATAAAAAGGSQLIDRPTTQLAFTLLPPPPRSSLSTSSTLVSSDSEDV
jgi:hypothetical protein